jgi:hypothetical protein
MTQGNLFDKKAKVVIGQTAEEARDAALQQVEAHADSGWMDAAEKIVRNLAAAGPFTADALWSRIDQPREPRALGALMRKLAVAKFIRPTGRYIKSARPDCHARPLCEWERVP